MTADIDNFDAPPIAATSTLARMPSSPRYKLQLRNAAEFGDVATLIALIDAGIDLNAANYAAWRGHTGAIAALLAAGAGPHARNSYGSTPHDIATREGH